MKEWEENEERDEDICPLCENHDMEENTQEEELKELFMRCAHLLRHRKEKKQSQHRVLKRLEEIGHVHQRDLADQFEIRPASLSELLIKLEEKGLIERTRLEEDRRNIVVSLSEQGAQALQALQKKEPQKSLFEAVDEEEKQQLLGILRKLKENWENEEEEPPHPHRPHHPHPKEEREED